MTDSRILTPALSFTWAPGWLQIEARDAATESAEKVGRDGIDRCGHVGNLAVFVAIGAEDRDHVAELGVWDVGDVERGEVHGNRADKRNTAAVHKSFAFIGEGADDAVGVSGVDDGDAR